MTRIRLLPLLSAAVLAPACARPHAAQRDCRIPAGEFLQIGAGPVEMAPGETKALTVGPSRGPDTPPGALPRNCTVRWSVDAGVPARVDASGRISLDASARPGTRFLVRAVMGRDTAGQTVVVADPGLGALAGTWQQAAADCTPPPDSVMEPVRELVFQRDGTFHVTFTPFETYRDYWGRYTYDAATGALSLRVENGNRIPAGIDLDGTVRIANGRLALGGMWLGDPRQESRGRTCTYVFGRPR